MKYLKYILPALLLAQLGSIAAAENVTLKIRSIEVDDNVYTPFYEAETEQDNEVGASQRWVRLTVKYSTKGGWIDELTLKHFALAAKHGGENPVVLTEKTTYINVGPGNHVAYVYMHPNCVKRYEVEANELDSAVVISMNGKVIATEETSRRADKGWMKQPNNKVHSGHLLSENETPFWFINYDFKEMIKSNSH